MQKSGYLKVCGLGSSRSKNHTVWVDRHRVDFWLRQSEKQQNTQQPVE
jgi:hypothetical protein